VAERTQSPWVRYVSSIIRTPQSTSFAATQRVFSSFGVALLVVFRSRDVPVPHSGKRDYGRSVLIALILIVCLFTFSGKCDTVYLHGNEPESALGCPFGAVAPAGAKGGALPGRVNER
jgi:hypothetical protein